MAKDAGWAVSEGYVPGTDDRTALAQEVFDKGLIFLVNQNVLHHYGYALGVSLEDNGVVDGFVLYKTDDPNGVWFDEATTVEGRKKLAEARLR